MKPSDWTEEKVKRLSEMWPTMASSLIAKALGKSRNAIIGKAHRMGLIDKSQALRPARIVERRVRVLKPIQERPHPKPTVITDPVPLVESEYWHCKAVVDDIKDKYGLAMICGKPRVDGSPFSFCEEHLRQYTTSR